MRSVGHPSENAGDKEGNDGVSHDGSGVICFLEELAPFALEIIILGVNPDIGGHELKSEEGDGGEDAGDGEDIDEGVNAADRGFFTDLHRGHLRRRGGGACAADGLGWGVELDGGLRQ